MIGLDIGHTQRTIEQGTRILFLFVINALALLGWVVLYMCSSNYKPLSYYMATAVSKIFTTPTDGG